MKKSEIILIYKDIIKNNKHVGVPTTKELEAKGIPQYWIDKLFGSKSDLDKTMFSKVPSFFPPGYKPGSRVIYDKNKVLKNYIRLRKRLDTIPTQKEINEDEGMSIDLVKRYFSGVNGLEAEARASYPEEFDDVNIFDLTNQLSPENIKDLVGDKDFLFITTAVANCPVNAYCLSSVRDFCESYNGALIILVALDPAHSFSNIDSQFIDSALKDEIIITSDILVAKNLYLSNIMLNAKQVDPAVGLEKLCHKHGTSIFAHPTQRYKPLAVRNPEMPKFLMTTGAITDPDYSSFNIRAQRRSKLSAIRHKMGGIIIDTAVIDGEEVAIPTNVQFDLDGSFIYRGTKYGNGIAKKVRPEYIEFGDLHSNEMAPEFRKAAEEICKELEPKMIGIQDAFSGESINPFDTRKKITSAIHRKDITLEQELKIYCEAVQWVKSLVPDGEVINKQDNHSLFINYYLESGRYQEDPRNYEFSLDLVKCLFKKEIPLEYAFKKIFNLDGSGIRWMGKTEELVIEGFDVALHGHKGRDGQRNPSVMNLSRDAEKAIMGHLHNTELFNDIIRVGTASIMDPDFVTDSGPGLTSWSWSLASVYPGGFYNVHLIVKGGVWKR